ncbi:TetR/AcrR family transcriptional regulator [Sediminitomix flava]|nr:TetR/AcrR family transcriptional regulator [Sediminitomix flava]
MLFVQMENERKTALSEVQAIPSFEVINRQSLMIIGLTEKYKFVILDTMSLFRQFPELGKLQSKYAHEHIAYIKAMFDYSVGSGNMIAEQEEGQYERLAKLVWMTLFHWPVQEFITPSEQAWELEVRKAMWDMFKPYLTDKGRENFERALLK